MKLRVIALSCLFVNMLSAQTGPGGVGDNTSNLFWLDANEITGFLDGDDLDTWVDVSGNGLDLTQPVANLTPEYRTGIINGYPVVRFNKTIGDYGRLRRTGLATFPTTAITTFIVNSNVGQATDAQLSYASAGNNNDFLLFSSDNLNIYRGGNTASGQAVNDGNWHIIDVNWRSSDGDTRLWLDGSQVFVTTHQTGTSITANGCMAIAGEQDAIDGAYVAGQAHLGDFAEVLVYNFSLNTAQRIIVANYLAAKYNIAMTGNDYFAYEATHSIDVAGIGRETAAATHTSAMSDDILQISNPSGLDADQEYLLFGHDDGDVTTTWTTVEAPNGGADVERLGREWRFCEINGDVGTVDILIDVNTLPVLPAGHTLYGVMVDSDGDFSTGATVYEVALVAGTQYQVSGVNIADGDYVAIAAIEPQVQFSATASDDFEPVNASIDIELNYIPATAVTVDYTTGDVSAVAPGDYTSATAVTATIPVGAVSTTIVIPVIDDGTIETDEDFTVTLSNPGGSINLGTNTLHTYTIHDDDNARKIYFDVATNSGDESISPVTVNVSMSSSSASAVTVDYTVTGGTATNGAGDDYVLAAGTVSIAGGAGLTTGSFTFTVNDDAIYEYDETVEISLSNPVGCNLDNPAPTNVGTGFTVHTYTILDNDTPPEIQFSSATGSGDESISPAAITVEINTVTQADAIATYTVADVSAIGGTDYSLASGTVTIPAGSLSVNLLASINDDGIEELPETFTVTLSAPIDATLGTNTVHTYTIIDNDVFGYLGPGGVGDDTNNKLWVSADNEVYFDAGTTLATNGQAVQEWHDRSGNNFDLGQTNASFKPNYITNVLNGLPAIRFNVNNNRIIRNTFTDFPSDNITTISVANTASNNDGHVSYATAADNNNYLLFNSANQRTFVAGANATSGHSYADGNWHIVGHQWRNFDGRNRLYEDGTQVYTGTLSSGNTIGSGGCLALGGEQDAVDGGYDAAQDYDGDMAEVIIYNQYINDAQRTIVNNYLGAKYGIAIANDLYVHQASYGHEVAGIGREDASNFHLDAQGSAIVRINTPSSMDDGDYMIWGHDNVGPSSGALTIPWSGMPAGVDNALHRVWRMDEEGDMGTVRVMFDVSALAIGSSGDLVLLIDSDDGDFVNATVIPLSSFSAPYAIFDLIDFADGDWFTLGSLTNLNPLPVELLSFSGTIVEGESHLYWATASEQNNSHFEIERSADGSTFEKIGEVQGANNSSIETRYSYVDKTPHQGINYYRLKQVDFDGGYEYSNIVVLKYSSLGDITIYPNPINNGELTVDAGGNEINSVVIRDLQGRLVFVENYMNQNGLITVDASILKTKGVYIISIATDQGSIDLRLIRN